MVDLMKWLTVFACILGVGVIWMGISASRNKHLGFQKKLEPRTKGVKR